MANINGKVYAMNVVTPMKPWKTWLLRVFFFILGHVRPLQTDLINLHFIQFARWVIVPRDAFPYLGGDPETGRPEIRLPALLQQFQRNLEPVHRRLLGCPESRAESYLALE